MRQAAAKYDLHTTEGLSQVQHLRFILPSGEVDTQYNGMTVRGGVLDDGIREMPGSEIIDGRCALQLPRLAAGCHQYDVFVSNNGTDNPLLAGVIHVAPRVTPVDLDDNTPADYLDIVIPEDDGGTITVISETPAWVDDAIEKSLQERGMYVTPVDGVATLSMSAGGNIYDFNLYTFALNSTYISGHLSNSYKLNKITLRAPSSQNDGTRWWARLYKITDAATMQTSKLGHSVSTASWVPYNTNTAECSWYFNAIPVDASDRLVVEIYAVDEDFATIDKLFIAHGAPAAHLSTEGVLIRPEGELIWRNYSRLRMTLGVEYTKGVSVGGIELASKKHFDALTQDVETTGEQVHTDAQAAQQAATNAASSAAAAQQALSDIRSEFTKIVQSLGGASGAIELDDSLQVTVRDGVPTLGINRQAALTWEGTQRFEGNVMACNSIIMPPAPSGNPLNGLVYVRDDGTTNTGIWNVLGMMYCGGANADSSGIFRVNGTFSTFGSLRSMGPAEFSSGVTMDQSLTVTGGAALYGGAVIGSDGLILNDVKYNTSSIKLSALWSAIDEQSLRVFGCGNREYVDLSINNISDPDLCRAMFELSPGLNNLTIPALNAPYLTANTIRVSAFSNFEGLSTFNAGVTMSQSLTVAGTIQASFISTPNISMPLQMQDRNYGMYLSSTMEGVYMRIDRPWYYTGSSDPGPTDTLTCSESDKRYTRCLMLTAAEYEALTAKEDVLYVLTDIHKLYFRDFAIN